MIYPLNDAYCAAVSRLPTVAANCLRDACISSKEKKEREEFFEKFGLLKTVAMIASVASVILFVVFPNYFVGVLTALVLYGAYEVRTVASNAQQVLDDFSIEAKIQGNKRACLDQLSKGTLLSRYVIQLSWR